MEYSRQEGSDKALKRKLRLTGIIVCNNAGQWSASKYDYIAGHVPSFLSDIITPELPPTLFPLQIAFSPDFKLSHCFLARL